MTEWKSRVIKEVVNRNFTFADLSKRFVNVDSSTGNIFCPFHANHDTPAAKMYWDEERELWILHCFGECHSSFTAYDYVNLILCERYQKYKSPLDFLKQNLNKETLILQLNLYKEHQTELSESFMRVKIDYINNTMSDCENVEDYIEELYTA